MQFGVMNHPKINPIESIKWAAKNKFDYIDFTVELPKAYDINTTRIKQLLKKHNLGIIGHSAWYLPFNFPYKYVRAFAYKEALRTLRILHKLGSKNVNIHFLKASRLFNKEKIFWYSEEINKLIREAKKNGMVIMIENSKGSDEELKSLSALFMECPGLKLHLDIGHTNLETKTNSAEKFLKKFRNKLEHVHFSDNLGQHDDHFTLGKGNINWPKIAKLLKRCKYDKTITLEVFDSKKGLLKSRKYIKNLLK